MRIGITGANGFLGSWLCNLLSNEHEIVGYVRPGSNLGRFSTNLSVKIKEESLDSPHIFKQEGLDILLMLDWEGVGNQYRNSQDQFQNIARQERVIISAALAGIKKVVGFGSQAELGPLEIPASEDLADNPTTEYGAAKVASRIQHVGLCENLGLDWLWCRIFSTYGPKDSNAWLIPGTLFSLSNNKAVPLTNCEQLWSFLHVLDFARAINTLLPYNLNSIAHVGNPNTVGLLEVIEIIGELTGKRDLLKVGSVPYRKDQVMLLKPACKTLESLGWRPKVNLREGIAHMLETIRIGAPSALSLNDDSRVLL